MQLRPQRPDSRTLSQVSVPVPPSRPRRWRPALPLPAMLCFFAVALLAVLLVCLLFLRRPAPDSFSENVELRPAADSSITLIREYAARNSCYLSDQKIHVEGLMLHSVGTPQPSAAVFADTFNVFHPGGREVCPHAFIQADGIVYQILPWNHYGWHAGGSANSSYIGIEMCEPDTLVYTGPNTFQATDETAARSYVEETYTVTVCLFAELCLAYGLDPLGEDVILSHGEAGAAGTGSDHTDPEHLWQGLDLPYTMDTFRSDVAARLAELQT